MVDFHCYGAPLLLVGSLAIAYKSGYLEPQQVALSTYRAFIQSMMFVETLMEPATIADSYKVVYYNGNEKLSGIPDTFTHAAFSWCRTGISGVSLLKPDAPLLHKLQSGKDPNLCVCISNFKIIALSGTKSDGTIVELKPPNAHIEGDVVLDALWREHFDMDEFVTIRAIDHNINVLSIDEKGLIVPINEVKSS